MLGDSTAACGQPSVCKRAEEGWPRRLDIPSLLFCPSIIILYGIALDDSVLRLTGKLSMPLSRPLTAFTESSRLFQSYKKNNALMRSSTGKGVRYRSLWLRIRLLRVLEQPFFFGFSSFLRWSSTRQQRASRQKNLFRAVMCMKVCRRYSCGHSENITVRCPSQGQAGHPPPQPGHSQDINGPCPKCATGR